jgi:hypothetical protein
LPAEKPGPSDKAAHRTGRLLKAVLADLLDGVEPLAGLMQATSCLRRIRHLREAMWFGKGSRAEVMTWRQQVLDLEDAPSRGCRQDRWVVLEGFRRLQVSVARPTHAFFTTYEYARSDDPMARTGATISVNSGVEPEVRRSHGARSRSNGPVMRREKSDVVER